MILRIILLILIILAIAILIAFSFYILLPSISKNNLTHGEDPVISFTELNYQFPMNKSPEVTNKKAVVMCQPKKDFSLKRSKINPGHTCFMEKSLRSSGADCVYACIGLGDCAKVCFQKAIFIRNNTAIVKRDFCCGCGKCAEVCPQHIIKMIPKNETVNVCCKNSEAENFESSCKFSDENYQDISKKGFKIWEFCYKIIRRINLFLSSIEGN